MATTAETLIAYRRELHAGGLDHDVINDLVKDAAQTMVLNEGLRVKQPEPQGDTTQCQDAPTT
ncbi:hypothetical protein [Streptomyces sp. IBSBF 2950]|uniref:hypothetical protein n=1 Tax=Streptomyces sp. IBSBF 2950 TaxID=2903528 RepID=UPI002FDC2E40